MKMKKILLSFGTFCCIFIGHNISYSLEKIEPNEQNNLEREAESLYQNQEYDRAISQLKNAIAQYQNFGDPIGEINARRNLALVYQQTNDLQAGKQAIATNLERIESLKDNRLKSELIAASLEVLAEINLKTGNSEAAIAANERIVKVYQQLGDKQRENQSKINLAISLSSLGLYDRAKKNLLTIKQDLADQPEAIQIANLLELGIIFTKIGNLIEAELALKEGLQLAKLEKAPEKNAQILLSLGDLNRVKKNERDALNYYQEALTLSRDPELLVNARLKQLTWFVDNGLWEEDLSAEIIADLAKLPISHHKIYAEINLADRMISYLETNLDLNNNLADRAAKILNRAIEQANQIDDRRAKSYASGTLGYLYEQQNRYSEAKTLTEIALINAIELNAPELSYQWQWQLGRLAKKLGETQSAIAAYSQAVNNLQSLRGDLVAISDDIQITFSESVEPVYRELADLLLKEDRPAQKNLRQARKVIEALQLARLNNYFREACLDTSPQEIDRIDREASVVYSIILSDRLALILSIPGQPLSYYASPTDPDRTARIETAIDRVYSMVNSDPFINQENQPYRELYNLLIEPIASDLQKNQVKTLVFVLDGILQRVPVAALFDGEKYLIEKYNIVLSPGLQLLKSPNLSPDRLRVIFGGISESVEGFPALPGVELEAKQIAEIIPTEVFLNPNFTSDRLKTQIGAKAFPIVHLATHGQFSSSAEDTFLLAWDRKINVKDLDRLLGARERQRETPIELLILSACETAEGDNRAALGIAGVALRSGARSTIATLWPVQDDSTALIMEQLYLQLNQPGINKAEALRNAQLFLLKNSQFDRPYFWAGFVLIGNWL